MRATLGVVTGALALSALAVPAAQADVIEGDTKITRVVVDGDNQVQVGATAKKFKVTVTATDNSGILDAEDSIDLYGPNYGVLISDKPTCTAVNATTSTCSAWVAVDPKADLFNNNAGTWTVDVWINAKDGDYIYKENALAFKLQRATRLTANASPEPVRRGKVITVTGRQTRVNWENGLYYNYGSQYVRLQYKKAGTTTWTNVKTIKGTTTGYLSATTTATYDGSYRFAYSGNSISGPTASAADYIDVQ
ncbi:calcium-binding protein [Streptomyces sp. NPDC053367]|uniref:calcium-binding protein n=1 Tax=Streptomyces sp. NPDC053367 TaxID=3365700 RepID=UPI0037D613FD